MWNLVPIGAGFLDKLGHTRWSPVKQGDVWSTEFPCRRQLSYFRFNGNVANTTARVQPGNVHDCRSNGHACENKAAASDIYNSLRLAPIVQEGILRLG